MCPLLCPGKGGSVFECVGQRSNTINETAMGNLRRLWRWSAIDSRLPKAPIESRRPYIISIFLIPWSSSFRYIEVLGKRLTRRLFFHICGRRLRMTMEEGDIALDEITRLRVLKKEDGVMCSMIALPHLALKANNGSGVGGWNSGDPHIWACRVE